MTPKPKNLVPTTYIAPTTRSKTRAQTSIAPATNAPVQVVSKSKAKAKTKTIIRKSTTKRSRASNAQTYGRWPLKRLREECQRRGLLDCDKANRVTMRKKLRDDDQRNASEADIAASEALSNAQSDAGDNAGAVRGEREGSNQSQESQKAVARERDDENAASGSNGPDRVEGKQVDHGRTEDGTDGHEQAGRENYGLEQDRYGEPEQLPNASYLEVQPSPSRMPSPTGTTRIPSNSQSLPPLGSPISAQDRGTASKRRLPSGLLESAIPGKRRKTNNQGQQVVSELDREQGVPSQHSSSDDISIERTDNLISQYGATPPSAKASPSFGGPNPGDFSEIHDDSQVDLTNQLEAILNAIQPNLRTELSVSPPKSKQHQGELESSLRAQSRFEIVYPNLAPFLFYQTDVRGDGNCLYRAFAVALYNDENQWRHVRDSVRNWYYSIVSGNSRHSASRQALYADMEQESSTDGSDMSLSHQLQSDTAWGSLELIQVLADAFDVEIFMHIPRRLSNGDTEWDFAMRGNAARLRRDDTERQQIHLIQYLQGTHWTAAIPGRHVRFGRELIPDAEDTLSRRYPVHVGLDTAMIIPDDLDRGSSLEVVEFIPTEQALDTVELSNDTSMAGEASTQSEWPVRKSYRDVLWNSLPHIDTRAVVDGVRVPNTSSISPGNTRWPKGGEVGGDAEQAATSDPTAEEQDTSKPEVSDQGESEEE